MVKRNLANIITLSRIVGTLIFLNLDVLSLPFFIVYTYCGISDVLDGFVARKLKTSSELGSVLDSVSDLLFYTAMMIKILPYLNILLNKYYWFAIYFVLFIRFLCYVWVVYKDKQFESRHTVFNKATGLLMFFLPYTLKLKYFLHYVVIILIVAYTSMFEELIHIIKQR